jgi:LCP family protein required for cell wall assembly
VVSPEASADRRIERGGAPRLYPDRVQGLRRMQAKGRGEVAEGARHRRSAPAWARAFVGLGTLLVLASGGGLFGSTLVADHYTRKISRQDIFADVPAGERAPVKPVRGPLTILLLGSDNFAGDRGYQGVKGQRSDTIILVHINESFRHVYAVSIQRDSYVHVPAAPGWPGGQTRINEALDKGGPALTVRTVQNLVGITIDHVVLVSFAAMRTLTDAVGGVDVYVNRTTHDPEFHRTWRQGWNHLTGEQAEFYVRQRYNLPGSDFDRIKRQQQYLRALVKKATSTGVLTDPFKLNAVLGSVTSALTVDSEMPVKELAWAARNVRPADVTFATLPTAGTLKLDGAAYEGVDHDAVRALGDAINGDDFTRYLAAYPPNDVSGGF